MRDVTCDTVKVRARRTCCAQEEKAHRKCRPQGCGQCGSALITDGVLVKIEFREGPVLLVIFKHCGHVILSVCTLAQGKFDTLMKKYFMPFTLQIMSHPAVSWHLIAHKVIVCRVVLTCAMPRQDMSYDTV